MNPDFGIILNIYGAIWCVILVVLLFFYIILWSNFFDSTRTCRLGWINAHNRFAFLMVATHCFFGMGFCVLKIAESKPSAPRETCPGEIVFFCLTFVAALLTLFSYFLRPQKKTTVIAECQEASESNDQCLCKMVTVVAKFLSWKQLFFSFTLSLLITGCIIILVCLVRFFLHAPRYLIYTFIAISLVVLYLIFVLSMKILSQLYRGEIFATKRSKVAASE